MKFSTILVAGALSFSLGATTVATAQPVRLQELERPPANTAVQYPETVVELFTSQGCSSCPPANKMVRELTGRTGYLTLSYSVDYWDYLGWKDTLGKPEFSARQRKYGEHFQGQVYTPQIIVNGTAHKSSFTRKELRKHVLKMNAPSVALTLVPDGVEVTASGESATLFEVRYTPGVQSIDVSRGENRGRTIKLANVVTSCKKIGSWKSGGHFTETLDRPEDGEALAILVQDGEGGPILSAASYAP